MRAVNKTDVVFALAQLLNDFLLFFAVVPQKAEIPADNERIARFEGF